MMVDRVCFEQALPVCVTSTLARLSIAVTTPPSPRGALDLFAVHILRAAGQLFLHLHLELKYSNNVG